MNAVRTWSCAALVGFLGLLAPSCAADEEGSSTREVVQQETTGPVGEGDPVAAADIAPEPEQGPEPSSPLPALDSLPWPADCAPVHKAMFAGGWDVKAPLGFERALFDEAAMLAIPENRHVGRRPWRGVTSEGDIMLIDPQIKGRAGPAMAYVWWLLTWNEIVGIPQEDLPAVLHLRHQGRIKLWMDGELLFDEEPNADGSWKTQRRAVKLSGPDDAFLVKCGLGSPELGPSANFELRVSTLEGTPHPGLIWQTVRVW